LYFNKLYECFWCHVAKAYNNPLLSKLKTLLEIKKKYFSVNGLFSVFET